MAYLFERRQNWHRIVGVERRGAPLKSLMGHPLPDPTRLLDEDFRAGEAPGQAKMSEPFEPWHPRKKEP